MGLKIEKIRPELIKFIDELAVQIIIVEPDDIISLGSVLNQLEEIQKQIREIGIRSIENLVQVILKVVEKLILNEWKEPREALKLIEEAIKLIQKKVYLPDPDILLEEEKIFIEKWSPKFAEILDPFISFMGNQKEVRNTTLFDQDIEIYKDFISEALEHLGTIELNIINLEQSPENKEYLNSIFRPFHTIKGVSGFLNLQQINQFSHAMETLLDYARSGKIKIRQEIVDFILDAVDFLKAMILDLKSQVESGCFRPTSFNLEPYLAKIESFEKEENSNQKSEKIELVSAFTTEENIPPLGELLSSKGIIAKEDVLKALERQKEDCKNLRIGEILISENKANPRDVIDALREQRRIATQKTDSTIKVDIKKLDNLIDMVGELVIALSLVQQNPLISSLKDQKLLQDFSHLKRITNELQKISMSLRMVPIKQTFQKMIRLVRDQAKKSEKMVDLIISGEDTEVDRNMVDSLYEPLVHMIRNAIDHGIEPPDRRIALGKPEVGKIYLKAYQQGGNVVIEIEDDGQGLNRDKIILKAKEKGLIKDEKEFTDEQINNIIFEPGFSTKDEISDLSGRGVGMDVVKKAIERLKGKVEIFSKEGKGTRFVLRIPLTLAIMDGIIVRIGDERFIIPTEFVKEAIRPRQEEIFTVHKKGDLIRLRDKLIPLIKLHRLIGIKPKKEHPWEALVLVIESEGLQNGLMIDDLLGKQEIVIKNMGEKLKDIKTVAGATIIGDGRVGLILDIQNILKNNKIYPNQETLSKKALIN